MQEGDDEVKAEKDTTVPSDKTRKKTVLRTMSMTPTDSDILDWLGEYLGCSRSEAMRTALRSFAGQMQALDRKRGRPKKGEEGGGF